MITTCVLILIPAVLGCSEGQFRNNTDYATLEEPVSINAEDFMSIEAEITEVMESWPLQLTLKTKTGLYHASLSPDTTITQDGKPFEAGQLSPGQKVKITGKSSPSEENAIVVQSIEVQ